MMGTDLDICLLLDYTEEDGFHVFISDVHAYESTEGKAITEWAANVVHNSEHENTLNVSIDLVDSIDAILEMYNTARTGPVVIERNEKPLFDAMREKLMMAITHLDQVQYTD